MSRAAWRGIQRAPCRAETPNNADLLGVSPPQTAARAGVPPVVRAVLPPRRIQPARQIRVLRIRGPRAIPHALRRPGLGRPGLGRPVDGERAQIERLAGPE